MIVHPRATFDLLEVKPGVKFSKATLQQALPDVETTLFFAKLYKLDAAQLSTLLAILFNTPLIHAVCGEAGKHSSELQDYIITDLGYEYLFESGEISFKEPPKGELLPEIWKDLEVTIAQSITDVAEKLKTVVGALPGKQGEMVFQSMMKVNAKRPVIGDYRAKVHHAPQREHLVILDVSGSMTQETIETIVEDVVAMSYMANAHLAIVSMTTTHWNPGEYSTDAVLAAAEFSGTCYETLAPLFQNQDWGVVVTIADYDSSRAAAVEIAKQNGHIETVLDISLVNRPSYLAEVVGQLATEVRPLLVGTDYHPNQY